MALLVRPYSPDDISRVRDICRLTARAGPFLPYCEEPDLACALFLDPHLTLEPQSCFVAELDGVVVGYLAGTCDTARFSLQLRRHLRRRLPQLLGLHVWSLLRGRTLRLLSHRVLGALWWKIARGRWQDEALDCGVDIDRYPAQCHLQVTREAQGKRAGLALMLKFHERLKAQGIPGQHCITVEEIGSVGYSRMMLALGFKLVSESRFSNRERPVLRHPGTWRDLVMVREFAWAQGPRQEGPA